MQVVTNCLLVTQFPSNDWNVMINVITVVRIVVFSNEEAF